MFRCKIFYVFLALILQTTPIFSYYQKGFCAVPVADCSCHCLTTLFEHQDATTSYNTLAISGKAGLHACPRDHQLLLHEEVIILDQIEDEIHIEVPNLFYNDTHFTSYRKKDFWTLKKNIITYQELEEKNKTYRSYLPHPIQINDTACLAYNSYTVTLKLPLYDQKAEKIYSAGTRFVLESQTDEHCNIWIFNPTSLAFDLKTIDRAICYTYEEKTKTEKLHDFINLLKMWAHPKDGAIPFVWGGCSFCTTCIQKDFKALSENRPYQEIEYWERSDQKNPYTGFDSSSLILRAAQIVGVPYFYKNAQTAYNNLTQLDYTETLQEGDLIWLPSGLLVVSDISENKIIVASGYQTGYGAIIECDLISFFTTINSYAELTKTYLNKLPLECKNNDGITKTFKNWSILKMPQ